MWLIFLFICIGINLSNLYAVSSEEPVLLSKEAREYHSKAKEAMEKNDLDSAIKYFQKAIYLDPYYAEAHNDLGIAYERKAMLDKAKNQYKKAINIRPDYAPAYMNLALLEESMGNIEKAVFYWKARIAFGRASEEWTKRAKLKLQRYAPEEAKKIDAGLLMEEVLDKLKLEQAQKEKLAMKHVGYGKSYLKKGEYSHALDEFHIAAKLSPKDVEIQRLIAEATIGIMQRYFARGIKYYKEKDYESAKFNFKKLIQMVSQFESKSE